MEKLKTKGSQKLHQILEEQGFLIYPIKGISMLPLLVEGEDTVKVVPLNKGEVLNVFDCALYHNLSDSYTLHRVIGVHDKYYDIVGDNNNNLEHVKKSEVIGKMVGYFKKKRYVDCESSEYQEYVNIIRYSDYKTRKKIYPALRLEWKFLYALIKLALNVDSEKAIEFINENKNEVNYKYLLNLAKRHTIVATVGTFIDKDSCPKDIYDEFQMGYNANLRKSLLFQNERKKIIQDFEKDNIDYCYLKGIVINDLYPKIGMREFADNDILMRKDDWEKVKNIFVKYQYEVVALHGVHDSYHKTPFYNFEMHRKLFDEDFKFSKYFNTVWSRLIKVSDNEYKMKDEDFYCYFLAHFYKHYERGGAGIRSFIDKYLIDKYICNKDNFDRDYVNKILKAEKLDKFEAKVNEILKPIFYDNCDYNDYDYMNVLYMMESGTYGILRHSVNNAIDRNGGSKIKYIFNRIFIPYRKMKNIYPVLRYLPFLLPIFWIIRLMKVVFKKTARDNFKGEVRALKEYDGNNL